MRMLAKIVMFCIFIFTNMCFASELQTNNLADVRSLLDKEAGQETLVIFDVDDVLIAPTDEFAIIDPIRKKLSKELKSKYDREKHQILLSDFFMKRKVRLVNPRIIGLLNNLKERHIPTTALTGWWTGRFGNILAMEELRFKGLSEVNISFAGMSPFKGDNKFPDLQTKGGIPIIKNGIILTALADKGDTLLAALDKAKLKFKKVIFIDDDLAQIESVGKACKKIGTHFIGIHYTEAKLIPLPKLDETTEKLRFEILEKEHIWLSDKELEERNH
jgi:hypothetical protein